MCRTICLTAVASLLCVGVLSQDANAQWCESCNAIQPSFVAPVATYTAMPAVEIAAPAPCCEAPVIYTSYRPIVTCPVATTQVLRPRYVVRPRSYSQRCCY